MQICSSQNNVLFEYDDSTGMYVNGYRILCCLGIRCMPMLTFLFMQQFPLFGSHCMGPPEKSGGAKLFSLWGGAVLKSSFRYNTLLKVRHLKTESVLGHGLSLKMCEFK